jgi:transposase
MQGITVGLDLAKNLFRMHAVDGEGQVVVRKRLARAEVLPFFAKLAPHRIGVEAPGTARYCARELIALGYEVRLMLAAYVKPCVKRGKNDAADAEAICEAVPTDHALRAGQERRAAIDPHGASDTGSSGTAANDVANPLRGHLADLGIVAAPGIANVIKLAAIVFDEAHGRLPTFAAMHWPWSQVRDVQKRSRPSS